MALYQFAANICEAAYNGKKSVKTGDYLVRKGIIGQGEQEALREAIDTYIYNHEDVYESVGQTEDGEDIMLHVPFWAMVVNDKDEVRYIDKGGWQWSLYEEMSAYDELLRECITEEVG